MTLGMRRLQVAFAYFLSQSAFQGSLVYRDATARGIALPVGQIIVILIGNLIGLGVYLVVRQNVHLVRYPHCNHKRLKRRAVSPHCGDI